MTRAGARLVACLGDCSCIAADASAGQGAAAATAPGASGRRAAGQGRSKVSQGPGAPALHCWAGSLGRSVCGTGACAGRRAPIAQHHQHRRSAGRPLHLTPRWAGACNTPCLVERARVERSRCCAAGAPSACGRRRAGTQALASVLVEPPRAARQQAHGHELGEAAGQSSWRSSGAREASPACMATCAWLVQHRQPITRGAQRVKRCAWGLRIALDARSLAALPATPRCTEALPRLLAGTCGRGRAAGRAA
jgi:hypothetical protein